MARNLQIIGEASGRLPAEFTAAHPGIEWQKIVALRHRIVHDYFSLDRGIVWDILMKDIPDLKNKLKAVRKQLKM